jgi:hypothetical protein
MAKFHGVIGYAQTEETAPGVHSEVVTERPCSGEILRNNQRWENGTRSGEMKINDDITLNNQFSVIGDAFAHQNLQYMRYVKWMGTRWKIESVEIRSPRLILTIGGVYNG